MQLPEKCVVPVRPKEYRYQAVRHCGAYNVQAVLHAYGLGDSRDPGDLHTSRLAVWSGSSISKDYYPAILRAHGLEARAGSAAGLPDDEKIRLLKGLLAGGAPVILSVRNYFHRVTGRPREIKGRLLSHWISLWGYDDAEGAFYAYDTLVPPNLYDALPVGNKKRSYGTLLDIWPGSIFSRLVLGTYSYIEITPPAAGRFVL